MIILSLEEIKDYKYEREKLNIQKKAYIEVNKKVPYRIEKRLKEINMLLEKSENDLLLLEAIKKIGKDQIYGKQRF